MAFMVSNTDRRTVLRYLAASPLLSMFQPLAFGADFWVKKKPGEWSSDDVEHMKTKSPWAKKVRAEVTGGFGGGGRGGGGMGGGGGGMGGGGGQDMGGGEGGGGGGRGAGGGGGGRGGGGRGGDLAPSAPSGPLGPELTIRWETAAPIQAATRLELPEAFAALYGLSVTGIPPQMLVMALSGGGGRGRGRGGRDGGGREGAAAPPENQPPVDPAVRQKEMVAKLMQAVTLTAKGRDPQVAVTVLQTKASQALIFGFERKSLQLTEADKDILFTIKLGMLTAKAKFDPKDMMFDGKLAL